VTIAASVVGIVVAGLAVAGVVIYNRFITLGNLVTESWRQVDVELRRRHDLVPSLVETVRGYTAHERSVLEDVARLRTLATSVGGPASQAAHETALGEALHRLLAVAESYPQLRANTGYVELARALADTEDRIAAARRFYNANVRALNTWCETFPANLIAGWFRFGQAEYFEVTDADHAVPVVDVGGGRAQLEG